MWTIVKATQRPSRRRREENNARRKYIDESKEETPVVSSKMVSSLTRDLRRTSEALREVAFVCRDVLSPVREFLEARADGLTCVHIVALGIGPFAREESRSGFLQMSLLLALKSVCEKTVRKCTNSPQPAADAAVSFATTTINTSGRGNSGGPTDITLATRTARSSCSEKIPAVITSFFDPATGQLHSRCCEKLGVGVETENRYGAYTPATAAADGHALLIAYMPHSPWKLLRNLFISNILPCRRSTGAGDTSLPLRSTLVIGNDLCGRAPQSNNDIMETLAPYLSFQKVRVQQNRGNRRCDDECEDAVDGFFPSGFSRNDMECAFSETAVMQLNTERETQLLEALSQFSIPPLEYRGEELL